MADPGGRAVYNVGLQPFACWDCGIEYPTCAMEVCCECCGL